jgi:hypothetical protein
MLLSAYAAPILRVDCARCRRTANDVDVSKVARRFGKTLTMGQVALAVAGSGRRPCGLAATGQCSAQVWEPPVWHWANLDQAWRGGWTARLRCRRQHAALKKTTSCADVVFLDIETLVATLGYDFKLERLPSRLKCPRCHSELVEVEWIVPDGKPAPFAPAADVVPLRLKPTPTQRALRHLRVVEGGK